MRVIAALLVAIAAGQLTVNGRSQPPLSSAAFPGSGRVHVPPLVNQLDRTPGVKLAVTGP